MLLPFQMLSAVVQTVLKITMRHPGPETISLLFDVSDREPRRGTPTRTCKIPEQRLHVSESNDNLIKAVFTYLQRTMWNAVFFFGL